MRILFLDNDPERHSAFDRWLGGAYEVQHVYTVEDAIEALTVERFDIVSLDCDLDSQVTSAGGAPRITVPTGQEVAAFVAGMSERPGLVVIHSHNEAGAARMLSLLGGAALLMPFALLDKTMHCARCQRELTAADTLVPLWVGASCTDCLMPLLRCQPTVS
jgi:CheY-like chemotaxis protein